MSSIYTLGYARWSIEDVELCMEKLDATLIDIRYVPHTTKPGFTQDELKNRFGSKYQHVEAFGNVNYKGEQITLVDPERGLQHLRSLEGPFVLMCGCKRPEQCHRSEVAEFLSARDRGSIRHLQAPSERAQKDLFEDDSID